MYGGACAFTTPSGMVLCYLRQVAIIRQSSLACPGNRRPVQRVLTLGTDWIATTPAGDEWVTQEIIAVRQFTRPNSSGHFGRFRPTRQCIRASRLARLALRYSQDPAVIARDGGRRRGHRIDLSSADRQGCLMGSALTTSAF